MIVVPFRKDAPWQKVVNEFLYFKMTEWRVEETIQDYKEHLSCFFKRFPDAFNPQKAQMCAEYMSDKIKPAIYNLRLAYPRCFFTWCVNEGIPSLDPTEGLKKKKDDGRRHLKKALRAFGQRNIYALTLLTLDADIRLYRSYQPT